MILISRSHKPLEVTVSDFNVVSEGLPDMEETNTSIKI